ncbi:MAG TPA: glutathione binding-like protein [Novosphingobium sp.]|nr:glutathione binding-like protein [Novosphingobium sp.]
MIEIFGGETPNVLKVIIAVEELGLEYNLNYFDIVNNNDDPKFRAVNPNGRIPAIIDFEGVDGTPLPLAESGAILYYLAEKHGKFYPTDLKKRYATMQWLMFQMSGIGPMFGQYVYFSRRVENQQHGHDRYATEVLRLYDVVEKRLGESRFLACDEYTIADMATFPPIRYVKVTGMDRSKYPNINRWTEEIEARPAVARAMKVLGEMDLNVPMSSYPLTEDQWDRMFGRGKYSRAESLKAG